MTRPESGSESRQPQSPAESGESEINAAGNAALDSRAPMALEQLRGAFAAALPEHPSQAVDAAFQFIEGHFAQRNPAAVDEALAFFALEPIGSRRVETAILRASFRARAVLPHWAVFLAATRAGMERDGEDWARALRGLV